MRVLPTSIKSCRGLISRFARILSLTLWVSGVLSSPEARGDTKNITSANVVIGKRTSYEKEPGLIELESQTASNVCFNNNCGISDVNEGAICNQGAYVYKITGYSGSNLGSQYIFANRFDLYCSDGWSTSIGQTATYPSSNRTILNPQGYQSVLVAGGCITDHIQIGGTDFGNAGFLPLASCSCAPGLSFVGFGTLPYQSYWPSFPQMSIVCDYACPKGTYYSGGICVNCPQGTVVYLLNVSHEAANTP